MLSSLNHAAGQDEFLRADLPLQAPEARLRDYEAELKARLHRLVDALDVAEFRESQPVTIAGLAYPPSPASIDILRRIFSNDRQSRSARVVDRAVQGLDRVQTEVRDRHRARVSP